MRKTGETKTADRICNLSEFNSFSLEQKLNVLSVSLSDGFEIYFREDSGAICLYDMMVEEFITENGFDSQNLNIFVSNLFLLNEFHCDKLV